MNYYDWKYLNYLSDLICWINLLTAIIILKLIRMSNYGFYLDHFNTSYARPASFAYKQNIPAQNYIVSTLCTAALPQSNDLYFTPGELIKLRQHQSRTTNTRPPLNPPSQSTRINLSKFHRNNSTLNPKQSKISQDDKKKTSIKNKSTIILDITSNIENKVYNNNNRDEIKIRNIDKMHGKQIGKIMIENSSYCNKFMGGFHHRNSVQKIM